MRGVSCPNMYYVELNIRRGSPGGGDRGQGQVCLRGSSDPGEEDMRAVRRARGISARWGEEPGCEQGPLHFVLRLGAVS